MQKLIQSKETSNGSFERTLSEDDTSEKIVSEALLWLVILIGFNLLLQRIQFM